MYHLTITAIEADDERRRDHAAALAEARQLLRRRGWEADELDSAQLFDLPTGPERSALLRLRADLGLSTLPDAYLSDRVGSLTH
ncbi:hypothetical protein SAMN04515671_2147 [Nakamurella panacisegetis]|uniref:Uncharacterized protein n=1 Tax=Nakamurella panacisegetis TaxID=1090615 RepID=A0A1H0MZ76_9ACTN|nr:hypothetical protein [Nakamurella panacisegetis]SDO85759.1 hypothetical protein SAMN04515671_2147 [Nakamurella panacisegetis]